MPDVLERPVAPARADQAGDADAGTGIGTKIAVVVALLLLPPILLAGYTVYLTMSLAFGASAASGACTSVGTGTTATDLGLEVTASDGTFRTLTSTQLDRAATIVSVARALGVSARGQQIAIMTALQESGLLMDANSSVPDSLAYPHDAVGSDHDSLNFFQQRAGWGTVAERMDPQYAATAFFGGPTGPNRGSPAGLLDIPGWETMPLGDAAQAVQISAFPGAYERWAGPAEQILAAVGGGGGCSGGLTGAALPLAPGFSITSGYGPRDATVEGASSWHAGVDLQHWPSACGDPVYAVVPGTVTLSSTLWLSIRNPDGFTVSYLHMYRDQRLVEVGDQVTTGEQIGVTGNVPPSGGCHLHLQIDVDGNSNPLVAALTTGAERGAPASAATSVDPEAFLALYGIVLCPPDSCTRE